MSDDEHEAEYGMVMPLVACEDQGGPYDAAAFVAGMYCGKLDHILESTPAPAHPIVVSVRQYVPSGLVPQLDLLAMHHGWKMTTEPWEDHPEDWTFVTFEHAEGVPGAV